MIRPTPTAATRTSWQHVRELQRRLYDGGFAGICFPTEYGGLGLDIAYQKAFDAESALLRDAADLEYPDVHHLLCDDPRHRQRRTETATHFGGAARRRGARPVAFGAQRRLRPGGCDHPRRAARRQVGGQRRQDVEHRRLRRRLWTAAGQDELGRAQARRPDDVSGARSTARASRCAGSSRSTDPPSSARSSSTTWSSATTRWSAKSTRAGRWPRASCITSDAPSAAARNSPAVAAAKTTRNSRLIYPAMIRAAGLADNERVREAAGRALTHRAVWEQLIDHVYRGVLDGSLPPTARFAHPAFPGRGSCARDRYRTGDRRQRRRRRRACRVALRRRTLPVPANRGARRRHHRDGAQRDWRTGTGLSARIRRRSRVPFNQVKHNRS